MRAALLPIHIVSAVGLIGADLALIVLGVRGVGGADAAQVYPAMSLIATVVMLPLGGIALLTGLGLAWVTGIGLRPAWVAAKLTITVLLAVVLVGFLAPGLSSVAEQATSPGSVDGAPAAYAIGPIGSATLLTINVVLATARPVRLRPPFLRPKGTAHVDAR